MVELSHVQIVAPPWRARPAVSLVVAVVGYSLTSWAWALTGPLGLAPQVWSGLHDAAAWLAVLAAVTVGSLGRIPVGMLTDRYGAKAILPAISLLVAVAVLLLAVVPGPVAPLVAVPLGVGGTSFAAGTAVVIRAFPPGRRGLWLSVFGAGMGVASAVGLVSRLWITVDQHSALPLLALALIGHAVLAATLLQDRPKPSRPRAAYPRAVLELLHVPATRYLSIWYAVAFGGLIAAGLYLPAYLHHAHHLPTAPAALVTVAGLTLAATCRPLGGWLCQRRDPVVLLRTAFAAAGAAMLALALQPGLPFALAVLATLAGCLGTASGAVQALLGAAAPPAQAGTVAGTVGAIGGLAGALPPLLLAITHGASGAYGVGLTLLAGVVTLVAWQLHRHGPVISALLAFPPTMTAPLEGGTTVVLTPATHEGPADLRSGVAALAGLAAHHELVIVVPPESAWRGHTLIAGLRMLLPRHRIVGISTDEVPHQHEITLVAELLDEGALPVVEATFNAELAASRLAAALGASDILRLPQTTPASPTPAAP